MSRLKNARKRKVRTGRLFFIVAKILVLAFLLLLGGSRIGTRVSWSGRWGPGLLFDDRLRHRCANADTKALLLDYYETRVDKCWEW